MEISNEKIFKNIHQLWHKLASNGKLEILMQLYHEEAILSSPLVPVLLNTTSITLKGYSEIYFFLLKGIQYKPNDLVRINQKCYYVIKNDLLICEYQHEITANKNKIVLETIKIRNNKIFRHSIYQC